MTKKRKPLNNIAIISFHDLWTMYEFAKENRRNCSVGKMLDVFDKRLKEVEKELFERTYGYNPWEDLELNPPVVGDKPEDIDLSQFDPKE